MGINPIQGSKARIRFIQYIAILLHTSSDIPPLFKCLIAVEKVFQLLAMYRLLKTLNSKFLSGREWSGGAMVLGKPSVPGRPTNLDYSRARAYCACSGCGWGCLDSFSLVYHFSFRSPSLCETARYRLKYCLKGPLGPNQPTNLSGKRV